ncbi:alpha/beta hydrolase [Arsenicicoccus dermatophilus]|uniref:alpha/beta hydrolase n=1 Tax=Arsenicicoccus dermatophilus TaxID=1076331 RepID=UPI001F4D03E7|nr:esterase family protein [Arsenicicoccus dermatophilus]
MELTGNAFVAITVMVAVAALVGGAVLSGRSTRSWVGLAQRLLVQLVVVALGVTAMAVVLNRDNKWYASWSDLIHGSAGTEQASTTGAQGAAAFASDRPTPTASATRRTLPPLPQPGSRVQTYTVTGPRSRLSGRIVVLLPAGYTDPAQAMRDYPVLVAMHGYPGTPEQWLDAMSAQKSLDAAQAGGKTGPVVLVAPQLEFPGGADSECVDAPGGAQVETWLTTDLPTWARSTLRVRTDRASWAATGFSAGAYCAAMVAVKHPDTYGGAIMLGGYTKPAFSGKSPLTTPQQRAAYDLPALVATRRPPVAIWAQTSDVDQLSYGSTKALAAAAKAPTSVTTLLDHGTGHRTAVWAAHLPVVLQWLGATVPGFSVKAAAATPTGGPAAPATPAVAAAPTLPPGFTPLPVARGRLMKTVLAGKASGVTMPVWVWLPPAYDDPAKAGTHFPVLMMFPGGDGAGYTQWYDFGQPQLLADGARAGKYSDFVMVMPSMQVAKNLDTECTDLPGQPKVETFFVQDVVGMVKQNFRVLPQATAWAAGGDSSGAYCGARLAFAHPTTFSTVASLSGYFVIDSNVPSGKTAAALATSPKALASGPHPPPVTLRNWVGSNPEEQFSAKVYRSFAAVVKPLTRVSLAQGKGGHNWKSFRTMLPEMFTWLTQQLDKPAPGPTAPVARPAPH